MQQFYCNPVIREKGHDGPELMDADED